MDLHDPRRAEAAFDLAELARRVANIVRLGAVAEVDLGAARARVRYDTEADGTPILSAWLPWITTRAGAGRTWWAPEAGEQVVMLAPGGDLPQAVILPALYRDAHPAPSNAAHHYSVTVPAGSIVFTAGRHRLRLDAEDGIFHEQLPEPA